MSARVIDAAGWCCLAAHQAADATGALMLSAAVTLGLAVTVLLGLPVGAHAVTTATIAPSLSPDRLGARSTLTFTIDYSGDNGGLPSPVRRAVLRLPAGLSLDVPVLRACFASRLRLHGTGVCPPQSRIGAGHALAEVRAGSLVIREKVAMWAFLGLPRHESPTFEILAEGHTPLDRRVVLKGIALADSAPYGEKLVLSIPPIQTLPLEPDASIVSFSLRIGIDRSPRDSRANAVLVPSQCPLSGFPFAARFLYADGTSSGATATIRCPG